MTNHLLKITSINAAAKLEASSCELLGKELLDEASGRYAFVFRNSPQCQQIASDFLAGRGGMVDVHRFLEAQKRLKALLFERSL